MAWPAMGCSLTSLLLLQAPFYLFLQLTEISDISTADSAVQQHHCDRAMPPFSPMPPAKKVGLIESGHQRTVITGSHTNYLPVIFPARSLMQNYAWEIFHLNPYALHWNFEINMAISWISTKLNGQIMQSYIEKSIILGLIK